jgi:hypothetical protein
MVLHGRLDASPQDDQSLASLWRANAQRISGRTIAACIGLGLLGAIMPLALGRATVIAAVSFVVLAFGSYAAVVRPSIGGRLLQPRAQQTLGVAVAVMAALAGVAAALLVLGTVFGGSLEVMRR